MTCPELRLFLSPPASMFRLMVAVIMAPAAASSSSSNAWGSSSIIGGEVFFLGDLFFSFFFFGEREKRDLGCTLSISSLLSSVSLPRIMWDLMGERTTTAAPCSRSLSLGRLTMEWGR